MNGDSNHPLAVGLIRIGEVAIEREDDAALNRYFAPGFVFHGTEANSDLEGLKVYFASLRAAFEGLRFERVKILGEGRYLAARTIVSGHFHQRFDASPAGPVEPTGRRVSWETLSLMRYDDDDRLAEEWVQTDNSVLLNKLSAN